MPAFISIVNCIDTSLRAASELAEELSLPKNGEAIHFYALLPLALFNLSLMASHSGKLGTASMTMH